MSRYKVDSYFENNSDGLQDITDVYDVLKIYPIFCNLWGVATRQDVWICFVMIKVRTKYCNKFWGKNFSR